MKEFTDYKSLLKKYITYVADVEGTHFLDYKRGYTGDQEFTRREWFELQELAEVPREDRF